jgi:tryptophan synthase alpha chain
VNRLEHAFKALGKGGRKAFVPFLPIGYPDLDATAKLLAAVEDAGADAVELGVPFSDSLADGPVIQAAYHHALKAGLTVDQVFEWLAEQRERRKIPFAMMVAYNLVHRVGHEEFATRCEARGVDALIVPDLPVDESGPLRRDLAKQKVCLVNLIAPTTVPRRAHRIAKQSGGFVYYISRKGVTGTREDLDADLRLVVLDLKRHARVPVLVGFGISTPEQARTVSQVADGVIVGSALVSRVKENIKRDYVHAAAKLAREMRAAIG